MTKKRAETTIEKAADEVWARVRDFGEISWIPNVASCSLDGDIRTVKMNGLDFDVVQQLVSRDDASRTLSYRQVNEIDLEPILGPGHVVRHLESTLAVTPKGDTTSWVTYDVDTADFMVDAVRNEYQGAVDNLKAELEG